jgi:hippurate hydrolase
LAALIPFAAHAATTRSAIDAVIDRNRADLDALYIDLHSHPELGFQEVRTAAILADRMRKLGFAVTERVGRTGVVAVYHNGNGPVVMVRTELDALPMEEKTGLAYASRAQGSDENGHPTFVAHSCGHDNHMAAWIGTAEALIALKDRWHGTLVFVGQPAEELVSGSRAMLDDGLFTRFPKPDYGFAAHVGNALAGTVEVKQGPTTSAVDTILITFKGVGSHGSMPDKGIDPIVEAAHFVTDVQSVIAREKDPFKFGVVTVGSFHAGSVSNIISDHADLQLTLRSYDPEVRRVINAGVERTARAAAEMARAPAPDIRHSFTASPVVNDPALAARTAATLKAALGDDKITLVPETAPGWTASEDYSEFVNAGMTHSVYFTIGGYPRDVIDRYKADGKPLPTNHSPLFAPDHPSAIRTGIEVLTLAVLGVTGG